MIQSNRPQPLTPNPQPLSAGPRAPTSEPSRGGRVVVLRPDHLGDVLLSRPAIEALASVPRRHGNASPQAVDLTVVAGPWATASLQGLPVRVVAFDFPGFTRKPKGGALAPYGALLAFAARLRRERYDAALVLRPDHWWGALAAAAAGIPIRVGHATPEVGPFLTHRVAVEPTEHASRGSLRAADALADALGLEPLDLENAVVRFQPSLAALAHAKAWIGAQVAAGRPIVVLHPGAGAPIKTWPARRWATIAAALRAEAAIVLTGGPADADLLAGIQAASAEPLPCASDLTWDQLAGLYQRADVVVGMDSGPLHLATAVGTPTVRVYGPTDPRIYGPALHPQAPTSAAAVLHAALPCIPCGNLVAPPCGYLQDPPCLASVAPQAVVAAVRGALPVATTPA